MRRSVEARCRFAASLLLTLAVTTPALAQDDVPPPPRIIDRDRLRPSAPQRGELLLQADQLEPVPEVQRRGGARPGTAIPNRARLAPLPEERGEPEEIVVVGGTSEFRLPDLGSRWRALTGVREQARFRTIWLPLYDPESPAAQPNLLLAPEIRRQGFIELFRVRFGRRADDE